MKYQKTALTHQDTLLPLHNEEDTAVHRYGFKINNLGLTYPPHIAGEVIKVKHVCRIPNSPKCLHGVINVRGHIIPAFDLNTLFYNQQATGNLFMILDKGSAAVAICINDFPILLNHAQELEHENIQDSSLPIAIRQFIRTCFHTNEQRWIEPDFAAFFLSLKS